MIEVQDLAVRYGDVRAVDGVSFGVARGELLTLLGPSGCGKTTTLRAIAGLEQPCGGSIVLDGATVYSAPGYSPGGRRNLATEKRGVSMVFQSYAIWPHMSVFENVAYGLRVRKLPRAEIDRQVERVLALVQMKDYAGRPASRLSGGQQQRVAVARAIAFSPDIVLFDEPLSNLDAKLRAAMRVELRELQHRLSFTSVYVTHDQEEALAISDRVIVMSGGKIEQIGTPQDIYDRPRNRFVADFVGSANLIAGRVRPGSAADGSAVFETAEGLVLRVSTNLLCPSWPTRWRRRRRGGSQCRARAHPEPALPRRFHRIRRRLAVRPAHRPPPADRDPGGGQRGRHRVLAAPLRLAPGLGRLTAARTDGLLAIRSLEVTDHG